MNSYTPDDLLQKVDAIRCNVEDVLRVVRPRWHAEEIIEKWRQQYGDEFKLIDQPENYLDHQAWKALLRKTLKDFEDVLGQVTKISNIMALKCKQHAEKAKTLGDDTEEYEKECKDANWLWENYEKWYKFGGSMNEFVYEIEGHANHPLK